MKFIGRKYIYGVAGEHDKLYLSKFWIGNLYYHIFHRGDNDPDCHDHPRPFWTFPLRTYVEEVVNPALVARVADDALHNRLTVCPPIAQRSLQVVKAFKIHYRPALHTHRVLGRLSPNQKYGKDGNPVFPYVYEPGEVRTIVWWKGRHARDWGFLRNRDNNWCWTPFITYLYRGGKNAPCE